MDLQVLGWICIALVGSVFFVGIYVYTLGRRAWMKMDTTWLILVSIFVEYSLAALLQSFDLIIFSENGTVGRLEVIGRALNFMAIFDLVLMGIFVDFVRKIVSRKFEKQLAKTIVFGKHILFVFFPVYEDFLRKYYGPALMITVGIVGIPAIFRCCIIGGIRTSQDGNISVAEFVMERFVQFSCHISLWILATNWIAEIISSVFPWGKLAQILPAACMLFVYYRTDKLMEESFSEPAGNADAGVSFRGNNGVRESEAQIHYPTPVNGYQTADLVPVPVINNLNDLILDLDSDEDERREMNILEFMKSESARQDKREAQDRELISWGQFLKESARDPEEAHPECSQTVHAMIHHVENVDEIEEVDVQGGACQSNMDTPEPTANPSPDQQIEEQPDEMEEDDKAESMSIDSYPEEPRYESPLSWQEIAVSPGRPVGIPQLALDDDEDEVGGSKQGRPELEDTPPDEIDSE